MALNETPGNESPAENPASETRREADTLAAIAATVPPSGDGKAAEASKPSATQRAVNAVKSAVGKIRNHGRTGYRRGAPCRNGDCGKCKKCVQGGKAAFGAPLPAPEKTVEIPHLDHGPSRTGIESVESDPPPVIGDFNLYGKAGARLVSGIVDLQLDKLRAEIFGFCDGCGIDLAAVERRVAALRVNDATKSDLELFYASAAMELGLPQGGGIVALGISIHFNLITHLRAESRAMRTEYRKLAHVAPVTVQDAPTPSAAAVSGVASAIPA